MRELWLRLARNRLMIAPLMLVLILLQIAASAVFDFGVLRGNRYLLRSDQVQIHWVPLAAGPGQQRSEPDEQRIFTPDGRWQGTVTTGLTDQVKQRWFGLAMPIALFALFGVIAGWPRASRKAPAGAEL